MRVSLRKILAGSFVLVVILLVAVNRSLIGVVPLYINNNHQKQLNRMEAKSRKYDLTTGPSTQARISRSDLNETDPMNGENGTYPNKLLPFDRMENRTSFTPFNPMLLKPFKFLKNYKNPCIEDNGSGGIKCLPYFYLVGAPKCGTTDLFKRLIKHPQISTNVSKEPHWITRRRFDCRVNRCPTIDGYFKKFKRAATDISTHVDPNNGFHSMVAGDFSASTLWDNDNWIRRPENRENQNKTKYTNADIIHHINPNAKIIAMLRNPTERVYSDYIYFHVQHSKNLTTFHNVVSHMVKRYTSCFRRWTLKSCLFKPEPIDLRQYAKVRMRIGTYSVYLEEYYRVFPKNQLLVLNSDDYKKNTTDTLRKIFDFLELAPVSPEEMRNISDVSTLYNSNEANKLKVGTMLPETKKLLDDFYAPFNKKLYKMTGILFS